MYSSRGFGELGSTKRQGPQPRKSLPSEKVSSSESEGDRDMEEKTTCPNCGLEMLMKEMAAHTVTCYRDSTKCKVCGEVISKATKKQHLARWRDVEKLR